MKGSETAIRSTTVISIYHQGEAAMGADGQATFGATVLKGTVKKIRSLEEGNILAGFAGSTSDAFALLEKFEQKLNLHRNNLERAAIELAKDWRSDRFLRRLEAMMIVMDLQRGLLISGDGNVISSDDGVLAIGSGALYARSAALALKKHAAHLSAEEMVREALQIAADICIYTNHTFDIHTLKPAELP